MDVYIASAKRGTETAYGGVFVDKTGKVFNAFSRKAKNLCSSSRAVGVGIYDVLRVQKHSCTFNVCVNDKTMANAVATGKTKNYTDVVNAISNQIAKRKHNITITKCEGANAYYTKAQQIARAALEEE